MRTIVWQAVLIFCGVAAQGSRDRQVGDLFLNNKNKIFTDKKKELFKYDYTTKENNVVKEYTLKGRKYKERTVYTNDPQKTVDTNNKSKKEMKYEKLNRANQFIKNSSATKKFGFTTSNKGTRNKLQFDDSNEDSYCKRSKRFGNGEQDCDSSEEDSRENNKRYKRVKYSIKFQHEKQKKPTNIDISIMRLHKKSSRRDRNFDDDDSSEEEDFPKKIQFGDDDDD